MRKHFVLLSLILSITLLMFGQAPRIEWQRCLGGTAYETVPNNISNTWTARAKPLAVTNDNGFIIGGQSNSNDGDVIGNHGGTDIWLARLDQHGSTIWKKSYGGSLDEGIGGVQQTHDLGFIVVGFTESNNGDVSGNHGNNDVWLTKLDPIGNIVWQKCLGGSNNDRAYQVRTTLDGGYIIAGETQSRNGDVTGLHIGGVDSTDAWIVKVNSSGFIVWQKCLGGTNYDASSSINLTNDGAYIIAAETRSNDGDVSGNHGTSTDIWAIKLDDNGAISWSKCYGGTSGEDVSMIEQTTDNGFVIAGYTTSNSGDVVGYKGSGDAWVVRTNANGTLIWQKCLGSINGTQGFTDIEQMPNGELVFSGMHEGIGGEDVIGNHGGAKDIWTVKLSSTGAFIWQRCYGGSGAEISASIVKSGIDGFLLFGSTTSLGKDNDVQGNHGLTNTADLWVVKLNSSNAIKGLAYFDKNGNGIFDAGEIKLTGARVSTSKTGVETNAITSRGLFVNTVDTGNYQTTIFLNPNFTSVPIVKISTFSTYNNTDSFSFALQAIPGRRDLAINAFALNAARPGFNVTYQLTYHNKGTDTIGNGVILFKKDSRLNFISSTPAPNFTSGDTLKWNYTSLKPFDTTSIRVNMVLQPPPTVNINDTIRSIAVITPVTGDLIPGDDTCVLRQRVTGSFDPNDKSENLAGSISTRDIIMGNYINYLIRFQNTGTDTAFRVVVRDTLDNKLDWNSLQMVSASHAYQLQIADQYKLTWTFANIKLVDSNRNESLSHGYIVYRITPKSNLVVGDQISNSASIYFDFNLPVRTNTQITTVTNNIVTGINNPVIDQSSMLLFPNPTADQIMIRMKEQVQGNGKLQIIGINGNVIYQEVLGRVDLSNYQKSLLLDKLSAGSYIISLSVGRKVYVQKLVIQ